jgi:ABC-type transport system involved in multi-copper enzyme maturation permease subunit
MNTFCITFKNEFIKMLHRKKLYAGMIIAAFIPLAVVTANVLALGWNNAVIYSEDLFRLVLGVYTPMILPLFAVSLVADAFSDEQSKGSMRISVLMPDSRTGHFAAKVTCAAAGALTMLLTLWTANLVFGLILPSRGNWLLSVGISILQALGSLLPILVVIGFSVLGAQIIKSTSGLLLTLIGLALVMDISRLWIGDLNGFLPVNWLGAGAGFVYLPIGSLLVTLLPMMLWTFFYLWACVAQV